MEKHIRKVLQYCEDNDVEINFSPDGIGLWTTSVTENPAVKNEHVEVHNVVKAVEALVGLRNAGWKNS